MRARVAKDKALPFKRLDPNARTIRAMKEARKGKLKRFERIEDLLIELKAKD